MITRVFLAADEKHNVLSEFHHSGKSYFDVFEPYLEQRAT
jgi:hypothetical protein